MKEGGRRGERAKGGWVAREEWGRRKRKGESSRGGEKNKEDEGKGKVPAVRPFMKLRRRSRPPAVPRVSPIVSSFSSLSLSLSLFCCRHSFLVEL
ncbi:unnamed protein product [Victoria cruziana]